MISSLDKLKRYFLVAIIFLSINILSQDFNSLQQNIPRNRLVTDKELISLINLPNEFSQPFMIALEKRDTTAALKHLADYLKNRKSLSYFFDHNNLEKRVAEFNSLYPGEAKKIIENANEFIEAYGSDIDWIQPGKDLIGRKHTPNTIRYLARQELAPAIAISYFLSDHKKSYLKYLTDEIKDFVADYEAGKTETGNNDVFERFYAGHRARNWLFMHQVLLGSDGYDWQDQILMLKVFILHGARLYDACKVFNWGNHQLHGLAGLYEMSLMYAEISVMKFWNDEAKRVILEHVEKEIKPDGFQFERASHYFKFDIINYFRVYQISKINNIELPGLYLNRFSEMFEAIVKLSMPNKRLPVLQDAQDSYLRQDADTIQSNINYSSNDAAELKDQEEAKFMSLGSLLFNSPVFKFFSYEEFPSDFYWFFSDEALAEYSKIPIELPKTGSVSLDSSNYYVMRTGWSKDDLYMVIDGGLAKYKPDHTHGGILGLIAFGFGAEILPNYRVKYSDPSYRTMKNSLVKNVALADDFLQGQNWISNTSKTGFGIWEYLPQPVIKEWMTGNSYDFFSGAHNGFESLGVAYERSILFFKPYCWLVIDKFSSDQIHSYKQIWQGNYSINSQYNQVTSLNNTSRLDIIQADPSDMEITNRKNYWTNSVQFEKKGVKDYSFLTVLYPQKTESLINPDIRFFERDGNKQIILLADSLKFTAYINNQPKLKLDEFETDAEIIATTYSNDTLKIILIKKGTYFDSKELNINSKDRFSIVGEMGDNGEITISALDKNSHELLLNGKSIKISKEESK